MSNVNRLAYHYQNVLRQDLLLKCSNSNIMDTPELCNINIVAQVAYDQKLVKQKRLALEIISGQKAVQFIPKSTSKLTQNQSAPFRFQSKTKKGGQPKYYLRLCLRKAACSNFVDKLISIICSTKNYVFLFGDKSLVKQAETQTNVGGSFVEHKRAIGADQRRPSDREGPLGQATDRAEGKRPSNNGSADRRSPIAGRNTGRAELPHLRDKHLSERHSLVDQDLLIKINGNIIELTIASNILRFFPEIQNLRLSSFQFGSTDREMVGDPFFSVQNLTIQIVTSATNQEETCLLWTGLFQKEISYDKPN
jgi:hypothetical protein